MFEKNLALNDAYNFDVNVWGKELLSDYEICRNIKSDLFDLEACT